MTAQEASTVGYRPKLLNRVEIAEGTMAFHLERSRRDSTSSPDETADFTLMNPPETDDSEGNTRTFSNSQCSLRKRVDVRYSNARYSL